MGELLSGAARLSQVNSGSTRRRKSCRHRVPPPSLTQAQREFWPSRGGCAASASRFSIPPQSGSCALVTPDSPRRDCFVRHPARCLPVVRCFSRQLASRPSTTSSATRRPLRRHLKPAGKRTASRRLSRSPSAPERTNFQVAASSLTTATATI